MKMTEKNLNLCFWLVLSITLEVSVSAKIFSLFRGKSILVSFFNQSGF